MLHPCVAEILSDFSSLLSFPGEQYPHAAPKTSDTKEIRFVEVPATVTHILFFPAVN